jgi:hypothetical protein
VRVCFRAESKDTHKCCFSSETRALATVVNGGGFIYVHMYIHNYIGKSSPEPHPMMRSPNPQICRPFTGRDGKVPYFILATTPTLHRQWLEVDQVFSSLSTAFPGFVGVYCVWGRVRPAAAFLLPSAESLNRHVFYSWYNTNITIQTIPWRFVSLRVAVTNQTYNKYLT